MGQRREISHGNPSITMRPCTGEVATGSDRSRTRRLTLAALLRAFFQCDGSVAVEQAGTAENNPLRHQHMLQPSRDREGVEPHLIHPATVSQNAHKRHGTLGQAPLVKPLHTAAGCGSLQSLGSVPRGGVLPCSFTPHPVPTPHEGERGAWYSGPLNSLRNPLVATKRRWHLPSLQDTLQHIEILFSRCRKRL